jgi:metal-responsive CopG/Arc/MetJ family transcriptional regulator
MEPAAVRQCLTPAAAFGHTLGMKVAVSIPDEVFAETESLAKRLKASRSEVYSRALHEFLGRHAPERVTEQMNRAVQDVGAEYDAFSARAARRVLKQSEW